MSADAWVGTWRPHRPRGPIAALYGGPGPKYGLPTNVGYHLHDPSRGRAPAYSFGMRGRQWRDERSPGPVYLLPPGTTAKGRDGIPAYSIHGRPRALPPLNTPGPACYSPERAGPLAFPCAPAYALRSRARPAASHQTPGPATYRLPPVLGPRLVSKSSAPNYSLSGRSNVGAFYQDLCKTPAPCRYGAVNADVYKRRAPQYSMLARTPLPRDSSAKPGPGAYSPGEGRRQGPTFGIRHSEFLVPLIVDVPD